MRDQVERDQALGRAPFGIDGEGDAELAEQLLGRVLLGDEGLGREIIQETGQLGVGAPHLAIGRAHFIEEFEGRKETAVSSTLTRSALCGKPPVLVCKTILSPNLGALPVFYFR